jgi:hypothetical protein
LIAYRFNAVCGRVELDERIVRDEDGTLRAARARLCAVYLSPTAEGLERRMAEAAAAMYSVDIEPPP